MVWFKSRNCESVRRSYKIRMFVKPALPWGLYRGEHSSSRSINQRTLHFSRPRSVAPRVRVGLFCIIRIMLCITLDLNTNYNFLLLCKVWKSNSYMQARLSCRDIFKAKIFLYETFIIIMAYIFMVSLSLSTDFDVLKDFQGGISLLKG